MKTINLCLVSMSYILFWYSLYNKKNLFPFILIIFYSNLQMLSINSRAHSLFPLPPNFLHLISKPQIPTTKINDAKK